MKPFGIRRSPTAHDESHSIADVVRHAVCIVPAVSIKLDFAALLLHRRRVANKVTFEVVVVDAHAEGLERVDVELSTWTIAIYGTNIFNVDLASSSEVARFGRVPAIFVRRLACVGCGVETPSVGLHDVKFGAGLTTIL